MVEFKVKLTKNGVTEIKDMQNANEFFKHIELSKHEYDDYEFYTLHSDGSYRNSDGVEL